MVLMGHSVGGYLAVAYAEKYPERVEVTAWGSNRYCTLALLPPLALVPPCTGNYCWLTVAELWSRQRLVLVSPVGVPQPPERLKEAHSEAPFMFKMVLSAWKSGFSPFTVAKLGLGHFILSRYVQMRFSDASWVAKPELEAYFYGSWTGDANSAGGYAHATLLRPGGVGELAYARKPLGAQRIPALRVGRISALYGERDWMDWRNMAAVKKAISERPDGGRGAQRLVVGHGAG